MRPPAWRWALAGIVRHRTGDAGREQYDQYVQHACEMQENFQVASSDAVAYDAVARIGPEYADAYAFWSDGNTARARQLQVLEDKTAEFGSLTASAMAVAQLEALILANKTPESISKQVGLSPESVTVYEALWFDVRDRLKFPGWISNRVIGTIHQGTIGTLLPSLVRAYGYYTKKTKIVNAVCSGFDSVQSRQAASRVDTFFASDAISAGGMKAALAVRLMSLSDRRTYARVVELHQEASRLSAEVAAMSGNEDEIKLREAVARIGQVTKLHYGKSPPLQLPSTPLDEAP
jgi:hypothetical protein